ncbi:hypothetical protein BT96DRAFT_756893, partial [Gymnopus androsaceus JB14]
ETTEQLKNLLERQGEQNVELRTNKEKVNNLQTEVERLRRQVHTLQQESADKEVKIVQLSKKHESAVEDLVGLNQALDSKQMELELVKRRHGVRGTGGSTSTPAPSRVSRRDSAAFSTPSTSRPSSVISNSDRESTGPATLTKERKLSSDSLTKTNMLSKSTRVNGSATTGAMGPPSTTKPRLSSMGPPRDRMSMGTPTPAARVSSLSRSASAKPASTTTSSSTAIHRRTSALAGSTSSAGPVKAMAMPSTPTASPAALVELQEEKENQSVDSSAKADRRRSMIP